LARTHDTLTILHVISAHIHEGSEEKASGLARTTHMASQN